MVLTPYFIRDETEFIGALTSNVIYDSPQTTSSIDHNLPLPNPPWE
jgi:hypothetical protein